MDLKAVVLIQGVLMTAAGLLSGSSLFVGCGLFMIANSV